MLFTIAAMTILNHRIIKILKFTLATWDLYDIVPSRLWATSLSQSGSRKKASKTDFFFLFIDFILVAVSISIEFLPSVPAACLLV